MESFQIPPGFVARMTSVLGPEVEEFLAALADPPDGLRANTLRLPASALPDLVPFDLEPLDFPKEGFIVEKGTRAGKHPFHAAGLYYLQDPAAMTVAALAAPRPGERVLDLAAAPGGKTTHLAALMRNEGVLIANDVVRSRARELVGNLERCGVRNAIVLAEGADRLVSHFGAYFDRVLLDAPCSGEAMFHKSAAARGGWSEAAVAGCARRQQELLATAADLVRPGGILVYATCTFAHEENENVIDHFLNTRHDFEPAPLAPISGAEQVGIPADHGTPAAYRLWPHRVQGAGHFVAAFRRRADAGLETGDPGSWKSGVPTDRARLFIEFMRETFPDVPVTLDRLTIHGDRLFELPEDSPSVHGLHVVRPGVLCGTLRPGRFEPAHALAMAISRQSASGGADLCRDDERVERYLEGHPIDVAGDPGWIPVSIEGFTLGWGKRVRSTVKNHYPKGLRRLV